MDKITILKLSHFSHYLKKRAADVHKGWFGHVLVVGGDEGFLGAVFLAARGALRVGAGLVSVATRPQHGWGISAACPEIMCHGIKTIKDLNRLLERATIVVIGPGLGQSSWAKKILARVLNAQKPLVMDADALNIMAHDPIKRSHWILTPHPGEAARLLNVTTDTIQNNRVGAAKKLQSKMGGIVVLKGHGTLIKTKNRISLCQAGNPGMASGGMGDVLSGVIGGLAAQGIPLEIAAELGVLVHAMAADDAAEGSERGLLASDLFPYLRKRVNL